MKSLQMMSLILGLTSSLFSNANASDLLKLKCSDLHQTYFIEVSEKTLKFSEASFIGRDVTFKSYRINTLYFFSDGTIRATAKKEVYKNYFESLHLVISSKEKRLVIYAPSTKETTILSCKNYLL